MPRRKKQPVVLGADDDEVVRKLLEFNLEKAGISALFFESGEELVEAIDETTLVCLTDLKMPGIDGITCLKKIKEKLPHIEVIILSNLDEAKLAITALREGAFDYLAKPFDPDEITHQVRQAMSFSRAKEENHALKDTLSTQPPFGEIKGQSPPMARVNQMISRVSQTDSTVLLTGESGTGKTAIALSLHQQSQRKGKPFISVSCPSLPRELLESEMFGHERGAFSGASERRLGRVELADGGTLFLDEIGEMPLDLQPKLLTFLQDKRFFRVGGQKERVADVRVIAATNRELKEMVSEGRFREDLYFRLNILPIPMPPLRDRPEDIPELLHHFINRLNIPGKPELGNINPEVIQALMKYSWPGNVRELENLVERACLLCKNPGYLDLGDLPPEVLSAPARVGTSSAPEPAFATPSSSLAGIPLKTLEKRAILETLEACDGNKAETARLLGITEKSVYNKLNLYKKEADLS